MLQIITQGGLQKGFCKKCGRTMKADNFYNYQDGKNKHELCKACLTMHVDNFNPQTFIWILKELDYPYIEREWNIIRDRMYARDPLKMNGMTVLGRYIAKMHLVQFNTRTWADTEKLNGAPVKDEDLIHQEQAANAQLKKKYENGEISEAEYRTISSTEFQYKTDQVSYDPAGNLITPVAFTQPSIVSTTMRTVDIPDVAADLTPDDLKYLAMKWGTQYIPAQWVALEQTYTEMNASFDIQDADTSASLILLCKTVLKQNQAIDNGDLDGYLKLSRVSESIRKTCKFTAAQNKSEQEDFIDCIGVAVAICERDGGFIPRFMTDIPQDKVDKTLADMNKYVYNLVTTDLGLSQRIENQIKKMEIAAENEQSNNFVIEDDMDDDEQIAKIFNHGQEEVDDDGLEGPNDLE